MKKIFLLLSLLVSGLLFPQQILTINGYVPAAEINIGDSVIAYDAVTAELIINTVQSKEIVNYNTYSHYDSTHYVPDVLEAYVINGTWTLCKYQSIWVNSFIIKHAKELAIGDTIYNGFNEGEIIASISRTIIAKWYRFEISGDHSYIADNLTLHNASRYWVGGTGTWNTILTTNWGGSSGGSGGSSVPSSSDDVIFDVLSNATAYTCTITSGTLCAGLTFGAPLAGALSVTPGNTSIFGNFFIPTTNVGIASNGTWNFSATSGTKTINANNITLTQVVNINGVGGTYQLSSDFTVGGTFTLSSGATFDPNGFTVNLSSNAGVAGAFTFYNLTKTGTAVKTASLSIANNITVTNIFTVNGNSAINRVWVLGLNRGTSVTVTAASVSFSNVDFMDITGAGAASWNLSAITGNSGDCGGNSGITFTTPATQTALGIISFTWSNIAVWTSRVPLPQDNVVISNLFSPTQTITLDMPRAGANITCSPTGSPTLTLSVSTGIFGNIDLTGIAVFSGNFLVSVYGRGSQTILSNGLTFPNNLSVDGFGGSYALSDNVSVSSTLFLLSGTFNGNGKNVTTAIFNGTGTLTRTLTAGAGTWTITGNAGTVWTTAVVTNLTYTTTPTINFNYSGATGTRTISSSLATTAVINVNITAGTDIITFATSSCAINSLNFTGFSGSFNTATAIQIKGDLLISTGMSVTASSGSIAFVGATQTMTTNGKNMDCILNFNPSVSVTLLDALACGTSTARTIFISSGSLICNGFNITHFGLFSAQATATVRVFNIGSSTYENTINTAITVWTYSGTNFSVTGSGILKFSGSTANIRTFVGGGATYPTLWYTNATGSGEFDITGSNTFAVLKCLDANTQAIKFTAGTTNTISTAGGFQITGAASNLISLSGITASTFTLFVPGNNVVTNYLSLTNCIARGGARWFAGINSTNVSGNNGWRFCGASNRQAMF